MSLSQQGADGSQPQESVERARADEIQTLFAVQQAITSRLDTAMVLQLIADEARRLTGAERSTVFLLEGDYLRVSVVSGVADPAVIMGYRMPVSASLTGQVMREGRPVRVDDAQHDRRVFQDIVRRMNVRSLIVVPLMSGAHAIGAIVATDKLHGGFTADDERTLTVLASSAVIGLENARLYREEQERRLEAEQRRQVAEALRDILAILNSDRSLAEILDFIVARACLLLGTEAGALYRLQAEKSLLSIQSACGLPAEYVASVTIPVGQGAVGRAVLERQPVAIFDVVAELAVDDELLRDPRRGPHLRWLAEHYRALLAVPLIVKGEVYGGIVLYYPEPRAFTSEEIELAATFGSQAALAIENARLRAQAEQSAVAAERSRLARDLHDAVTQTLFSASLIAEVLPRLWERNPQEGRHRLAELRQLTRGALAEMRTLLMELRPAALTEAGLGDLLRQLAEATTGRAHVPVALAVEGTLALPPEVQIALYRIAQEALNNVARHAAATKVTVSLHCAPERVELRVVDDGRGFDPALVSPEHLGLDIMRERAEAIGASLRISSQIGRGTSVVAIWSNNRARGGL